MIRNGSGDVIVDCDDREQDMKLKHVPNTSPERTPQPGLRSTPWT